MPLRFLPRFLAWLFRRLRGGDGLWLGFSQDFLDESRRHGCSQNRAVPGPLNFQALEKRLHINIGALCADAGLGGVEEVEKSSDLVGHCACILFTMREGLGAQMQSAEEAPRTHCHSGPRTAPR